MGLFDKWKKKEPETPQVPRASQEDWDKAFQANVKFFSKEGEETFGALVLTEGVEIIFPKAPWEKYGVDGKPVATWKMILVSITKEGVIGMGDYAVTLAKLRPYFQDEREEEVLTRGLTLEELEGLLQ